MNTPAPLVSFPARTRTRPHPPQTIPRVQPNLLANPLTQTLLIAVTSYALLFLTLDLRVGTYEEGSLLTAAFRAMIGQIPHRDFYIADGPAQTYLLAALFKLFGPSVLVERLYDLAVQAAVVTSVWHFARKLTSLSLALTTTAAVLLLLFALSMNASASVPASLAAFWATWLLIQHPPTTQTSRRNPLLAGLITSVTFFFRYDIGIALCATHLVLLAILTLLQPRSSFTRLRQLAASFLQPAAPCLFGFGLLMLPFAAIVRAASASNDLIFDAFTVPAHFDRAHPSLPFPSLHFRTLDNLAVYLPIPILLAAIAFLIQTARPGPNTKPSAARLAQHIQPAILAFTLLTLLFYTQGLVRISPAQIYPAQISPVQIYPALITSTLLLATLIAHRSLLPTAQPSRASTLPVPTFLSSATIHPSFLSSRLSSRSMNPSFLSSPTTNPSFLSSPTTNSSFLSSRSIHSFFLSSRSAAERSAVPPTLPLLALSLGIASISLVWLSIHRILDLRNHHAALLQTIFTPPNPNQPSTAVTPLNCGLPFTPADQGAYKQAAINFLRTHTTPLDTLYIGITQHDRILANDNLTYFAAERLPATKWSQFAPGLQSQLPIQAQMVADLEATQPPYIALASEPASEPASEFDQNHESTATSLSSGVYLLDDYLAQHYHPVQTLPTITLYQRLPR